MNHIDNRREGYIMENNKTGVDCGGEQGVRSFSGHEGFWITPEDMPLPDGWRGMKVLKGALKHDVPPSVVKDLVDNRRSSVWPGIGREPMGSGVFTYHTVGYSDENVYHIIYGLKADEAKLAHACQGFCTEEVRNAKTLLG